MTHKAAEVRLEGIAKRYGKVEAVKPLLRDLPDIIVGTPGRLAQHLKYDRPFFILHNIMKSNVDSDPHYGRSSGSVFGR